MVWRDLTEDEIKKLKEKMMFLKKSIELNKCYIIQIQNAKVIRT